MKEGKEKARTAVWYRAGGGRRGREGEREKDAVWAGGEKPRGRGRQRKVAHCLFPLFLQKTDASVFLSGAAEPDSALLHPEVRSPPAGGGFCRAGGGGCCEPGAWVPTRSITALTVPYDHPLLPAEPASLRHVLGWWSSHRGPGRSRSPRRSRVSARTLATDYCRIARFCARGARAQPLFIDSGGFALL